MPPLTPCIHSLRTRCCESSSSIAITRRLFSTSSSLLEVGPESPKYIEVPQPPQQRYPPRPIVKGILPVPRNVFPHGSEEKTSPSYLAATTPEPSSHKVRSDPELAWKQRMAARRRKNLREGVTELAYRKEQTDKYLATRGARRQSERQQLIDRPEREDERLTNPSVTHAIRQVLNQRAVPSSDHSEVLRKRRRVKRHEVRKREDRQDSLHTLYMHARNFITTEAQLNQAVDEVFGTEEAPAKFGSSGQLPSIWAEGKPMSVQDMLNASTGGYNSMALTSQRLKRIAEELTGGKI